jgi:hypothetical protein
VKKHELCGMTSFDIESAQPRPLPNTGSHRARPLRIIGRAANAIFKSKNEYGASQATPQYSGMEQPLTP